MATNKPSRTRQRRSTLSADRVSAPASAGMPQPSSSLPASPPSPLLAKGDKPVIRLIPIQAVENILGVKRTFITERVANKEMPLPVKFGRSRRAAIRWFEHEILEYVMQLAAERDAGEDTDGQGHRKSNEDK